MSTYNTGRRLDHRPREPQTGRMDTSQICPWAEKSALERAYHDQEWGRPVRDAGRLFEFLLLEGLQAGLSWRTVLEKREHYRAVFQGFDPSWLARVPDCQLEAWLQDTGLIRNRLKMFACRDNARAWEQLCTHTDPVEWLWSFVDGQPVIHQWRSMEEVPAQDERSRAMSRALKGKGFRFVGPVICYAFMQAVGMVDDHLRHCPAHTHNRARV